MVQSIPKKSMAVQPTSLLQQLLDSGSSGCLAVQSQGVTWSFYFQAGHLFFATHSIDPFDRLERHLRRLSNTIPALNRDVRTQARTQFEALGGPTASYEAICWLNAEGFLEPSQAGTLLQNLALEVLESFLLITVGNHELINVPSLLILASLPLSELITQAQTTLNHWRAFQDKVTSPFQRPYLFTQTRGHQRLTLEQQQRLGSLLRGYSIRHLAVLTNQNELKLVKSLYPFIQDGTIFLREPQVPFDLLPRLDHQSQAIVPIVPPEDISEGSDRSLISLDTPHKQFKIVCIDDSPTMLQELSRFLSDQTFTVTTLNDSVKALMEVMRIQPDLILLDVGMPNIDGYKFCRVIRNHAQLKTTPIIMVTGNTGLIDRAKAKLVGATDYMTKPFTQSELLKMVFQYLS
ncbi:response regulator with CheY-like receiver domain and winged-helix DNA-binding domain [Synechococcus sp. PCC 6312]|nr:response regulator with CheY-like receiver domain and winged-helix DNA-binding domain [Synechococcus sp. PCC 6312]